MTRYLALLAGTCLACTSAVAQDVTIINDAAAFPEGPVYLDGTLYYVEYGAQKVTAWDGTENRTFFQQEGCGPNAVAPFGDDLVVACYDSNSLVHLSLQGEVLGVADHDTEGSAIVGPNDMVPDNKGGVYVTGSGPWESEPISGKVFHLAPDMTVTALADDIHYANGILLTPDGSRLLVGEPEAQRIISFAVGADGRLSDRRLFLRLNKIDPKAGDDAYPDGFKFGPDGNLYVGQYSGARIAVISPDGKTFVRGYDVVGQAVPNLTFTPDGRSIVAMTVDDKSAAPWPGKVIQFPLD